MVKCCLVDQKTARLKFGTFDKNINSTISDNQDVVESIEFSNDCSALIVKYKTTIKAYSISSGYEISYGFVITAPLNDNRISLDLLSFRSSEFQNYLTNIENFYFLSSKNFEKMLFLRFPYVRK